jgi:SSS family solute:Na+ symporter
VLISIIGFSVWPHLFMKAFTARDDRTIRRTVVLYPTFQIFLVPLYLIGFSGILFGSAPERADQILPHMLMHMEIPALLVGLFCAGALAASMSSGDAMAHAAASIAIRDGLVEAMGRRFDEERQRSLIRITVFVLMVVAYVLAITYKGDLVTLLLYAYGPIGQFAPVVLATLFCRRATGWGVLVGLLAGSALTILFGLRPDLKPFPLHPGIYGLIVNLILLVIVSAVTQSRVSDRDEKFLEIARTG